jgi:plastocyanin
MAGKAGALAGVGAVAVAIAFTGSAASRSSVTVLRGTVGPGFTITLKQNGVRVTRLRPGLYRIVVADRSSIHNFKLEKSHGGELERRVTTIGFVGTRTTTVRLTAGQWEYYCEPHESSMKGHFTVGR